MSIALFTVLNWPWGHINFKVSVFKTPCLPSSLFTVSECKKYALKHSLRNSDRGFVAFSKQNASYSTPACNTQTPQWIKEWLHQIPLMYLVNMWNYNSGIYYGWVGGKGGSSSKFFCFSSSCINAREKLPHGLNVDVLIYTGRHAWNVHVGERIVRWPSFGKKWSLPQSKFYSAFIYSVLSICL